ncbi:putative 2-phosphosulfolactate phosphatase [Fulvitalea axinellae]|uniref:Probable 2-phosphosulfolactate phosphatase n=1 Tax=Fulvitalea axinellae TaxID=1182444 RepID=A0AAU9CIZ9_9BACT|nr:putative 2-phosphosulfolactate phosphatase [Fulvitalea axinellae]
MNIEVCASPDLSGLFDLEGKVAVVVDILRATSCMTAGIAEGVSAIRPVSDLEVCRGLMSEDYVGAAERNGAKVDGFDIGNSPFSYMDPEMKGAKVAVTTTNGTVAIERSKSAERIIIGSFLNLSSVASYVRKLGLDVVIVCAGWKGRPNLEDTLFAGALAEKLAGNYESSCDSLLMAKVLWEKAKLDLSALVYKSAHVARLKRLNIGKDIELCMEIDRYGVVPEVNAEGEIVKAIF